MTIEELKDHINKINQIKIKKMQRIIKIGSVVTLKSGGPKMIVTQVDKHEDEEIAFTCIWFYKGEVNEYTFDKSSLELN